LEIIHRMISQAKGNIKNSSFYFLLWGWITTAGSIGHYLLLEFSNVTHPEWVWTVIIIGILASIGKGRKDRHERGASTYTEQVNLTIWAVFLINYVIILFFIAKINFYITPVVLVLTAGSTFLSGTILKFNPLKWGAVFIWAMSIVAFLVTLPYQLLATSAAIVGGYLLPGYILKHSER